MNLINGSESGALDPRDRGIAYGDGVFRTIKFHTGRPVLWSRQYARLAADSAALGIVCPPRQALEDDLQKIATTHADGVIRITLTRGSGPRGYAIPDSNVVTRILSWSAFPAAPAGGVRVRWCQLRLAIQPALAGIKHLNRLENVLARSEWRDPQIAEGLLCDHAGHVIGGTMSNLFALRGGALVTPRLDGSGIAGVMRELILDSARADGIPVSIAVLTPAEIRAADALYLVNSVIGVWPVAALDDLTWGEHLFTPKLREWIRHAEHG
jgi:4-amino-4-deoxychorismate lyase